MEAINQVCTVTGDAVIIKLSMSKPTSGSGA